jgi:glycosyltransferase involved in cell wall biosynthesis
MPKLILTANTDWYLYNFRFALVHDLRDQGFEVVLVSPPGEYTPLLQGAGFRCIPWQLKPHSIAPWRELRSLLSLARIYHHERPDLIHHHTIKAVLYGSWAAYLTGVKGIVNTIAGRGYVLAGAALKARFLRKLIAPFYRFALRKLAMAVIFENQYDRQFYLDANFVDVQRSWLIAGVGTDPQRFFYVPEPPLPIVVLMAARILWDKGVGVFVGAARILHANHKIRMVLVGAPVPDNPGAVDEALLQSWHQEGIIEWWGWRRDMEKIYQSAHIVVLPTFYGEGVPTTLIEAAASGRAIIATDVPGCRAIVRHEHNGLLVPPNDAQALAQAVARLSQHAALREKMGAAGRQIVLERFTHKKINQATIQIYRHLLDSNNLE